MFHLRKWYLDLVTDEGVVVVVYTGEILGLLRPFAATSLLLAEEGEPFRQLDAPLSGAHPTVTDSGVHLDLPQLSLVGHWHSRQPPLQAELLSTDSGSVHWKAHAPAARTDVHLAGGRRLQGLGYAEEIEMSLAPWQLPIRELRWGRFLSAACSVVWIDWRGPARRHWVWIDGRPDPAATVADDGVRLGSGSLEFDSGRTLRDAAVVSSLPRALRWAALLLPPTVRRMHECRRLARSRLTRDGRCDDGWTVYEVVRWG